jgi:hypothetical protein
VLLTDEGLKTLGAPLAGEYLIAHGRDCSPAHPGMPMPFSGTRQTQAHKRLSKKEIQ